jgi:hypothetical protein
MTTRRGCRGTSDEEVVMSDEVERFERYFEWACRFQTRKLRVSSWPTSEVSPRTTG